MNGARHHQRHGGGQEGEPGLINTAALPQAATLPSARSPSTHYGASSLLAPVHLFLPIEGKTA
jgi:hypothetical protein